MSSPSALSSAPHFGVDRFAAPAGRILLSGLFLASGAGKIAAYDATAAYMQSAGLPAPLLPAVIGFELLAPLALIAGWRSRLVAFLLAGFSIVTALLFHSNFGDPAQQVNFLKNLSIAGGLLMIVAHGGGPFSLDRARAA
ncbi:MAG: DoxX family protein [Parvularculaceae bacterium]|nr:DoxX family protein [Parvularculaceae bacterium]